MAKFSTYYTPLAKTVMDVIDTLAINDRVHYITHANEPDIPHNELQHYERNKRQFHSSEYSSTCESEIYSRYN